MKVEQGTKTMVVVPMEMAGTKLSAVGAVVTVVDTARSHWYRVMHERRISVHTRRCGPRSGLLLGSGGAFPSGIRAPRHAPAPAARTPLTSSSTQTENLLQSSLFYLGLLDIFFHALVMYAYNLPLKS